VTENDRLTEGRKQAISLRLSAGDTSAASKGAFIVSVSVLSATEVAALVCTATFRSMGAILIEKHDLCADVRQDMTRERMVEHMRGNSKPRNRRRHRGPARWQRAA
jgi:hypothetical protein